MAAGERRSLPDISIWVVAGTSAGGVQHRQDRGARGCVFLDDTSEAIGHAGHSDDR